MSRAVPEFCGRRRKKIGAGARSTFKRSSKRNFQRERKYLKEKYWKIRRGKKVRGRESDLKKPKKTRRRRRN